MERADGRSRLAGRERFVIVLAFGLAWMMVLGLVGSASLSCLNAQKGASKSLNVAGDVGAESMRVIIYLYKEEVVNDEEYEKAKSVYILYKKAYDTAVDALVVHNVMQSEETGKAAAEAIEETVGFSEELADLLEKYRRRQIIQEGSIR